MSPGGQAAGGAALDKQLLARLLRGCSSPRLRRLPDMFEYANMRRLLPACCAPAPAESPVQLSPPPPDSR